MEWMHNMSAIHDFEQTLTTLGTGSHISAMSTWMAKVTANDPVKTAKMGLLMVRDLLLVWALLATVHSSHHGHTVCSGPQTQTLCQVTHTRAILAQQALNIKAADVAAKYGSVVATATNATNTVNTSLAAAVRSSSDHAVNQAVSAATILKAASRHGGLVLESPDKGRGRASANSPAVRQS
jgi:hypothetical protein